MTFWQFASARLQRLYPLLALGTVLGGLVTAGKLIITHRLFFSAFWLAVLWGFLLLPFGGVGSRHWGFPGPNWAFPLNAPMWSLFYEILINLIYAGLIWQLTSRRLIVALVAGALGIISTAALFQTLQIGAQLDQFPGAAARVVFSFSVGILLSRLFRAGRLDFVPQISPAWLVAFLLLILYSPPLPLNWEFEAFSVLIVFPTIVALGSRREPGQLFLPLAKFSGRISYPLYIIHFPILRIFVFFIEKYHLNGARLLAVNVAAAATSIGTAYAVAKFYDEPLRRAIKSWLVPAATLRPETAS